MSIFCLYNIKLVCLFTFVSEAVSIKIHQMSKYPYHPTKTVSTNTTNNILLPNLPSIFINSYESQTSLPLPEGVGNCLSHLRSSMSLHRPCYTLRFYNTLTFTFRILSFSFDVGTDTVLLQLCHTLLPPQITPWTSPQK